MSNDEKLLNTCPVNQQNLEMDISEEMVKSESSLEELLSYFNSNLLEGWCHYGTETKLIFIHTNMLTRKEDICFTLDYNFLVKVSFSQRPEFIVNDTITSVSDIINFMKKLHETILCEGTGIYYQSFAPKCTGQMPSNSTHSRQTPRCVLCRTLRKRLIMKSNSNVTKSTIQKAREAVEKHKKRYNQLVQKKRILNQELIRARENAQRSEELLRSVISELPDTKKLSILAYLDEKLENNGISHHSSELFREQGLSKLANHHQNEDSNSEIPDNFVDCGQDIVKKEDIDVYNEDNHSKISNNFVDCGSDIVIEKEERDVFSVKEEEEKEEGEKEKEKEEGGEKEEEEVFTKLIEKCLKRPILEIKPLTSKGVAISVLKKGESESGTVNKYYSIIQLTNEEMYERIEKLKNEDVFLNAPYKCGSCVLTFKDENELVTHNNDLHLPKLFHVQCEICNVYVLPHRLYDHKAAHRLLYKCNTCGVVSCVGGMVGHLPEHSVPLTELNELKETAMLLNPSSKYDIIKKYEFKCSECNKCFEKEYLRHRHVLRCHRKGYKCETCGRNFALKVTLNKHIMQVHTQKLPREECPICHTMVRSDLVKAHAKIHSDRQQFYCNICNKKLHSKYTYEKHMRNAKIHEVKILEVLKYKCDHCSKGFRYKSTLEDHINYNHMGRTEYKCPVCQKALSTRRGVTKHVRSAHQGLKRKSAIRMCQICGKTFKDKRTLEEHELIHTGEKPLSCDICSRSFRQKACLYTHRRRVHNMPLLRKVVVHTSDAVHPIDDGLSH